jgi:methylenetetrahydrofolate dehydrogenase (NADP+)/methenyltetrahydrofolate cyclohydrolase
MTAQQLDGKALAAQCATALRETIQQHQQRIGRPPHLAAIQVGNDDASSVYIGHKIRQCDRIGIDHCHHHLSAQCHQQDLLSLIEQLNEDANVDGILLQLPLPPHINAQQIIPHIVPHKDVDGFHPENIGRLVIGQPLLRPCTPYGIIQLLEHHQIPLPGKHAVIIGTSNIVGRPMALELLLAKCTVTSCHRQTRDLANLVRQAEILIVASGTPDVIQAEWLSRNAVVVDVGIHRLADGTLRGDCPTNTAEHAAWLSPVPGGVGPMTVSTLLQNTVLAWQSICYHSFK